MNPAARALWSAVAAFAFASLAQGEYAPCGRGETFVTVTIFLPSGDAVDYVVNVGPMPDVSFKSFLRTAGIDPKDAAAVSHVRSQVVQAFQDRLLPETSLWHATPEGPLYVMTTHGDDVRGVIRHCVSTQAREGEDLTGAAVALEGLAGKLGLLPFWSEVDVPGEGWTWVEAFPWESQQAALRRHMGDDETEPLASASAPASPPQAPPSGFEATPVFAVSRGVTIYGGPSTPATPPPAPTTPDDHESGTNNSDDGTDSSSPQNASGAAPPVPTSTAPAAPAVPRYSLGLVLTVAGEEFWFCGSHYYHVVECLLSSLAWLHEYHLGPLALEAVVISTDKYQPRLHDPLVQALFPSAAILTSGPVAFDVALVARWSARGAPRTPHGTPPGSCDVVHNALHQSLLPATKWCPRFRELIFASVGASLRPRPSRRADVVVAYATRTDSLRELSAEAIVALSARLREIHGVQFALVDFGGMTLAEQVRLASAVDVLMGVHGNAMTNLVWLPDHGAAIEFFGHWHHYYFQTLAEACGRSYVGLQEGDPRPYRRGTRRAPDHGTPFFGPSYVDWEALDREMSFLLDAMLT